MWTWAEWVADQVVGLTPWDPSRGGGAALHFFVFDLQKIVVLVAGVSFIMALVRGALPLARIRVQLERPGGRVIGYPVAAMFGAITPFCSCSSVPVFLGFVQAGFPIGVAFAFLITSPLVNEIAVALLAATFGWKIALIYAATGISLGVVGGLVLTALRSEKDLTGNMNLKEEEEEEPPWLLIALSLGAALHGFVPEGFFTRLFADTGSWTVPLASLAGLPLYLSANATVPLLDAFVTKGVPLGTALAFLLSSVGVSFPELVMLRSVICEF